MVRPESNLICCALVLAASAEMLSAQEQSDYAAAVISYVPGAATDPDWVNGEPYTDAANALGRPTVDTTGDIWTAPVSRAVPILPVYSPWRSFEIVTIGEGGKLILAFDHAVENDPRNPCGVDLIVFGNAWHGTVGYWRHGDPNGTTVSSSGVLSDPVMVEVSQDGEHWFAFADGPYADDFAPTLGRMYQPDAPDPTLPENHWWGQPTDPTVPVNPQWTAADFSGRTVAEYAQRYGYSAGGTGFDLDAVNLDWIRYVRIDNPSGSGVTPEIDAVSDVAATPFPDFDCDADVDADDLDFFDSCTSGPDIPQTLVNCLRADLDGDGDVDQSDFGRMQRCISGPDALADRACLSAREPTGRGN